MICAEKSGAGAVIRTSPRRIGFARDEAIPRLIRREAGLRKGFALNGMGSKPGKEKNT